MPGLSLLVGKTSARWRLDYKLPLPDGGWSGGKRLALGDLATVDVDAARDAAAAAKTQIANGVDPVSAKRAGRAANIEAAASHTVAAAIDRFVEERSPDWSQATTRSFRGDLALICRTFGDAPLALVTRPALVDFLNGFLAEQRATGASGVVRATRVAQLLGALWRQAGPGTRSRPGWGWRGVDPNVAERLPVTGRDRLVSRRRVLSEREIATAWQTLRTPHPLVGAGPRLVLMLSLATGLRIGAIALTRVADLDLDPEPIVGARDHGPTIRIPAEDGRKASARDRRQGADLILPLSPFAVSLWREAIALGRGEAHVFRGTKGRPLSVNTISKAWRLLDMPPDTVAHDLRRTMRTHLGDMDHGGTFEDEERLLGHVVGSAVARAYDRGRRLARLRPLADAWGRRLAEMVSRPAAPVFQLRARA
jgi:integrase